MLSSQVDLLLVSNPIFRLLTNTDHGDAVLVGLIRFVMIVPLAMYQSITENHWNVIRNHPELHSGIYDTLWVTGEKLAQKWVS
jgi:hypothetical protein